MDAERLRELVRLLKEEGLTEITVSEGDERVTVRQAAPGRTEASTRAREEPPAFKDGTFPVTAPLVGTFYTRPNPEEDPFVTPGDVVQSGDVVGIIEAMKVMNEVVAEAPGRLLRPLVQDGTAVEYGQPLLLFERL